VLALNGVPPSCQLFCNPGNPGYVGNTLCQTQGGTCVMLYPDTGFGSSLGYCQH
jgi:hypothetical protein